VRFGFAAPIYSHVARNTTVVPGNTKAENFTDEIIGEMYRRIAVEIAVAKHLITASASI
jgi:hypothetical protein